MRKFVIVPVLICLASTTHAQEGRGGGLVRLNVDGKLYEFNAALEARTVKGAPYSADVVNEGSQTLSDGNRIIHHAAARVYRDSDGRVRREEDRGGVSPVITITDPVAGVSWTLDADNRTARQSPALLGALSGAAGDEMQRLYKVTALLNGVPTNFAVGPNGRGLVQAGNEQRSEEHLTPRTIEGLRVEGLRRTITIPAGAIGNERPIVVTSDEWTSPELKVLVLSESSDPRTGTSTYKLVNVRRGDPPASLFQVPADYKVQTAGPGARGGRGGPPQR
jgi:hypothetical protein